MKVENMPKAPAPPRNESAFATIGSQEEVQPAATQMEKSRVHAQSVQPTAVQSTAPQFRAAAPPAATPVFAPQARAVAPREIVEDEPVQAHFEPEVEEPQPARTFGTLTGGAVRSAQRVHVLESETHLDAPATAHTPAPQSGNWVWIAACAFFLIAGLAGGAFYFRQHPNSAPQTVQSATNSTQAQSADPNQPAPAAASFAAAPDPSAIVMEHSSRSTILPPGQEEGSAVQSRVASNVSAREAKPSAPAPTNFAASPARPVARRNARVAETAAPSVGAAPSVTGAVATALPDVLGASSAAPPPPPMLNRVRVGGVIIEPKLLRSVPPVYPSSARQAGITGNVVVNAQVDKAGNVVSTKAVSGPVALQAAAMNAMKLWKYQPSTLDGDPIATQVTVTIKFQQQ
jgi:TonB family protein